MSGRREPFVCLPKTLRATLRGDPRALSVVFALACYANAQGVAWPSLATLARDVGCSQRTIERTLAKLERLVVIERDRSTGGAAAATTRYSLRGVMGVAPRGDIRVAQGATPVSHELEKENEKKPVRATAQNGARRSAPSSIDVELGACDRARAALRALELGERHPLASWVVNVGSHYVHDEQLFGEELREAARGDVSADLTPALFERAKLIALERDAA